MFAKVFLLLVFVSVSEASEVFTALLRRIEELENKDIEKSARLAALEHKVKDYQEAIHDLTVTKGVLIQGLDRQAKDLEQKQQIIDQLTFDCRRIEGTAGDNQMTIQQLTEELRSLKMKLENTIKTDTHLNRQSMKTNEKHYSTNAVSLPSDDKAKTTNSDKVSEGEGKLNRNNKVTKSNQWNKRRKVYGTKDRRQFASDSTDLVAFHAVLTTRYLDHLGTNENIKFNTVHLNLGNPYHNQHGLFIAPKRGLYLFSVTLAIHGDNHFWACLTKNGNALVSSSSQGADNPNQGSVTAVVSLEFGDEVWVRHVHPVDGIIWGNGYSSFTGVLLAEY